MCIRDSSETVNVASLDARHISIQAEEDNDGVSVSLRSSSSPSSNNPIITITLSENDLNNLKSLPTLATNENNTYLTILSLAIQDMADRRVSSIFSTAARQVQMFTADQTGPEITDFELDMDSGVMIITFNEFVNESSLDLTQLTLRSSRSVVNAQVYTLTNTATTLSFTGTVATLQLSVSDLNSIKVRRQLAISNVTTFLQASSEAVLDMNGNNLMMVPPNLAEPVSVYVSDTNRPSLMSFDLDVNTQAITLHFNETIDSSPVQLTHIILQQDQSGAAASLPLTNGTVGNDNHDLIIELNSDDLNELSRLGICTTMDNCFIAFFDTAFADTAGNEVISINDTNAMQVGVFTVDRTPPRLVLFTSFDLDAGLLTLQFSETVRVSTLDITALSLDQFPTTDLSRYTLSGGSMVLGSDRDFIAIQLSTEDLNGLKETGGVCFGAFSCWVRFPSNLIEDITMNNVIEVRTGTGSVNIIEQVADFTPDTTSPQLIEFDLDLNSGIVNLVFDEPIRSTEIDSNLQQLTLANSSDGQAAYTLTGGTPLTAADGTEFRFNASHGVVNFINNLLQAIYGIK